MRPSRCFGDSPFVRGVNTAHDALIASLFSTIRLSAPGFWNLTPYPSSFFFDRGFLFFFFFFLEGERGKLRKIKGVWRYWRFHSPLSSGSTRQRVKLPFVANFATGNKTGRGLRPERKFNIRLRLPPAVSGMEYRHNVISLSCRKKGNRWMKMWGGIREDFGKKELRCILLWK